ncbi:hypothetical protein A1O3_10273 [Capronia epimyces CBS 606.96]|uniref:Uncharacterized protein n=1 Tax=Capronia epimyces CBS 606.96 TaxID=1182542 RepID=W9XIE0_9EURO|nr:uncharacterized protein A1O3_10273 [Capronia epimyces CBS 606.96]EXJ77115.1 hypothetical protein A1O3_10273 [Capronia epimyces CBS 606.96]
MDDNDRSSYEDDTGILTSTGHGLNGRGANMSSLTSPQLTGAQHYDIQDQQDDLLERLAGHYSPFEGYDLLVKAFEKTVKGNLRASFKDGIRLAEVDDEAIRPKIGITFLPGADTPQVNQMEQIQMTNLEPDQKDASWRVNTAGALLKNFDVDKSMSIIFTDNTPAVVASARQRMNATGPFIEPSTSSQRAVAVRQPHDRMVTIDSDNVKIVNTLSSEKWDLEGLLVEVDQSSLMAVILNYRQIINRGGSNLPCGETIKLLDMMIEDARRLCIRSPILFRMSTRRHIISSKNTRYGVDHGTMFQTLTTSSGIKNIISLSAAYFNSLASYNKQEQQLIRPRFLQMLVLLLSLLNDDDLRELAEFLEVTYSIRAERQHIELLILKVLPLMSINSKIFLQSLVTAFDGPLVNPSPHLADQPVIWNIFLHRLLQHKYILPGTIEQLGDDDFSWVVNWPDGGYSDSSIFKNLHSNEVTAVFTNGFRYIVSIEDLENITRMTPRKYALIEATLEARSFDLDITDVHVNEPLYRAIWEINSILTLVKSILPARPKHTMSTRLNNILGDKLTISRRLSRGGRNSEPTFLPEIKGSGRLTYHVATLSNGQMLAVSYKVEGRKITRRELVRHLASDLSKMRAAMEAIETTVHQTFEEKRVNEHIRQTVSRVRAALAAVWRLHRAAEENKEKMEKYSTQLGDEPITKVLYPIGSDETPVAAWNHYKAWHVGGENVLYIEAHRRVVRSVTMTDDNTTLEVTFHGHEQRYFITPLRKLEEDEYEEELKPEDRVILAGQYLIVVEPSGQVYMPNGGASGDEEPRGSNSHVIGGPRAGVNGSSATSVSTGGVSGGGRGGPGPGRQQIPLERVMNWVKITGVEMPRRKRRHPQVERSLMVRSAIR